MLAARTVTSLAADIDLSVAALRPLGMVILVALGTLVGADESGVALPFRQKGDKFR
jgi:hypothetical protein